MHTAIVVFGIIAMKLGQAHVGLHGRIQNHRMKSESKRTIFVAGMGTSPAVLTNAVWALAHQKKPVVPDEVVVLITKNGKELLRRELIDNGVWDEMLAEMKREKIDIDGRLIFGETSIRTIPDVRGNEIDDLRTG